MAEESPSGSDPEVARSARRAAILVSKLANTTSLHAAVSPSPPHSTAHAGSENPKSHTHRPCVPSSRPHRPLRHGTQGTVQSGPANPTPCSSAGTSAERDVAPLGSVSSHAQPATADSPFQTHAPLA